MNKHIGERDEESMEEELKKLPDWIKNTDGIDIVSGIEHCETAEDYMDAVAVFAASIPDKTSDIEGFLEAGNWSMYTLRVHSLKSMARLIGAAKLSSDAAFLEDCGKKNDVDTIKMRTPKLLDSYRAFMSELAPALAEGDEGHVTESSDIKPEISDETLKDAYMSMAEFALCYDTESVQMVLDSLMEYRLSEKDERRVNNIRHALSEIDWAKIRGLLSD